MWYQDGQYIQFILFPVLRIQAKVCDGQAWWRVTHVIPDERTVCVTSLFYTNWMDQNKQ